MNNFKQRLLKIIEVSVFILIIYLSSMLIVSLIYNCFILKIEAFGFYLTCLFISLIFLRILFYLLTFKNKKKPRKMLYTAVAQFSIGSFVMLACARQLALSTNNPLLNIGLFIFALMWVVIAMSTFWGQTEYINERRELPTRNLH